MAKEKVINLYIDAEWYLNQRIFLIGYSYDNKYFGQLYGKKLTPKNFKKLFSKVNGSVFCYGPDTGMLEKFFKWKFRDKFRCVNLMKVFKDFIKKGSFKLKDLEHRFGIRRKVMKYKTSIFQIWRDWRNPTKKKAVLLYNKEDVVNLVKLALKIFQKFKVKIRYLEKIRLK
ncbi:MAG: ribonuclease H-like domain-containing protein [Chitinophagaceae bacterium]|nr:ribonuclease H-like domain-containing protein [Chitinophagaceae bacterium]